MLVHCQCTDDYRRYLTAFVEPAMKAQGLELVVHRFEKVIGAPWSGLLPVRLKLIQSLLDKGEPFIFTGVDVYYRPHLPILPTVEKALQGADIVAQGDGMGMTCADFMAFNPTDATRWWWKAVTQLAPQCTWLIDQEAENRLLGMINAYRLPAAQFFNLCMVPKLKLNALPGWLPEPDDIPREAKLVHAACVLPGEKWAVLSRVKEICEQQDAERPTN
jgi:hypothetical protein